MDTVSNKNFDSSDFNTWARGGINNRWQSLKKSNTPDGMVVIGLVTTSNLPEGFAANHENLANDLVKGLLRRYVDDERIARKEVFGKLCDGPHIGFAIFMAFGY